MENMRNLHLQQQKNMRVLLLPFPLQGHLNPMIELANILYSRGFSIVVIHFTLNFPDTSKYPDFTFQEISDGLPVHNQERCLTEELLPMVYKINSSCAESLKDGIAKLLISRGEDPICCLITDVILPFSQKVADQFGIPRFALRTTSVCACIAITALSRLSEKGYLQSEDPDQPVEELPHLTVKDLPLLNINRSDDKFRQLGEEVYSQTNASSGFIWNTEEQLEQSDLEKFRKDYTVTIYPVGPLHKHLQCKTTASSFENTDCLAWLDTQLPNSVLYVSFGTVISLSESEFFEIAWGICNSNHPFIWVIRPNLVLSSECIELDEFKEDISDRGCIVSWAPQQDILAHPAIGGFWTHCGWNSSLESMSAGVPMICMSRFGDQSVNAKYITDVWKVGIPLSNKIERKSVEEAIKRLMEDDDGIKMRETANILKGKLSTSVKPGGHSFNHFEKLVTRIISFS